MTEHATPSFETTHDLLASTRALTRRVRDAQRGAWLPLALFGLATLASAPFNRYGTSRTCNAARSACSVYSTWAFVYWPTVLVLIYVAVAWFYVSRSRERGVGTRVKPYVVAGIVLAVVLTAASVWLIKHPSAGNNVLGLHVYPGTQLGAAMYRLVSPAAAIGLALLVLARIERNVALLIFTLGYLAVVVFAFPPVHSSAPPHFHSPSVFTARLLVDSGVLLLGSVCFAASSALVGRHIRRSAP
jgi:hypothetical protein